MDDGDSVGFFDGDGVGDEVEGFSVGLRDGDEVVGLFVGRLVVGSYVGLSVGLKAANVQPESEKGDRVGVAKGEKVGLSDDLALGERVSNMKKLCTFER